MLTRSKPELKPQIQQILTRIEKQLTPTPKPISKPELKSELAKSQSETISRTQRLALLTELLTKTFPNQPAHAVELITQLQHQTPTQTTRHIEQLTRQSINSKSKPQPVTISEQAKNLTQALQTYEQLKKFTPPAEAAQKILTTLSTPLEQTIFKKQLETGKTTVLNPAETEDELLVHLKATIFKTQHLTREIKTIQYEVDPEVRQNRINTLLATGRNQQIESSDGLKLVDTTQVTRQLQPNQANHLLSKILHNRQPDGSWENTKISTGQFGLISNPDYEQLVPQIVDQNPPVKAVETITYQTATQADIEKVFDGIYYQQELPKLLQQFMARVEQVKIDMTRAGSKLISSTLRSS